MSDEHHEHSMALSHLTPDERRVQQWLARELARPGLRQITSVELRLLRGSQIAVWDRATESELFEREGHSLAMAIVAACGANVAGTTGETFAIVAISSIGGANARSSMRLRIEGDIADVESPTATGLLEQAIRHNEFLMRMAMQGSAGTIEQFARMNESLLVRVDTLEQKRQQHFDEREQLESARHEREIESQQAAAREARRNEMVQNFTTNILPLVAARLMGGLPTGATSGRSPRERLLDSLLSSIADDEAKLGHLAALLTPEQLAMLAELGRGMEHANPATPPTGAGKKT